MRIQWNSDAAQDVLERLRGAQQGLEDDKRQAEIVRGTLEEADPKGDNKALRALSERFETCTRRLDTLAQEIDSFRSALERADAAFADAERSNQTLVGKLEQPTPPGVGAPLYNSGNWEPSAYAEMRDMRLHPAPVPEWLLHRL